MSKLLEAKQLLLDTKPPSNYLNNFTFDVPFFTPHIYVAAEDKYIYNFSVLWNFFKPNNYMVIGVLMGSAEAYAMKRTGHVPNKIVVCDVDLAAYNPDRTTLASAYKNISKYCRNAELVVIRADSKHTTLMRKLGPYDLIFVDGEHSKPAVINDLDHALASMTDDGIILVHDLELPPGSVKAGYDEWLSNHPEMEHVEVPGTTFQLGLGMICKR